MATATNETIIRAGTSYTASCSSSKKSKLAYNGIKTEGKVTGPQWTLKSDTGARRAPRTARPSTRSTRRASWSMPTAPTRSTSSSRRCSHSS